MDSVCCIYHALGLSLLEKGRMQRVTLALKQDVGVSSVCLLVTACRSLKVMLCYRTTKQQQHQRGTSAATAAEATLQLLSAVTSLAGAS